MLLEDSKVSNAQETPMAKDKGSDNCDDYKKNNENDEFRRRVEESIDKVNRGWKAESIEDIIHSSKNDDNNSTMSI
ncbi:conserved hypothetical protein [Ricinus communis]|uniref:Uncharacterized protein n=1 Tax=Ricinus communis TaxID=3988 RepID=B9SNS1_RICCO|nr:conserved hypothetical protein [Ricinus communis]